MDIYDDTGILDTEKARRALGETTAIHNPDAKRVRYTEIQIATLLDVADSLRVVALEASFAMQAAGVLKLDLDATPETEGAPPRDFLVVGDLVHVIDETEPGEVMALGFDQGEPYAIVDFATVQGMRYYVRNLERLVGDQSPEPVTTQRPEDGLGLVGTLGVEDAVAALRTEGDELEDGTDPDLYDAPDEAATVDDIDADFEGDNHPAADDALAVLKANEAQRKAAKKGKKK